MIVLHANVTSPSGEARHYGDTTYSHAYSLIPPLAEGQTEPLRIRFRRTSCFVTCVYQYRYSLIDRVMSANYICTRNAAFGYIFVLSCTRNNVFGYISKPTCTRFCFLGYTFLLLDRFNSLSVISLVNMMMNKQVHQFCIDIIITSSKSHLLE